MRAHTHNHRQPLCDRGVRHTGAGLFEHGSKTVFKAVFFSGLVSMAILKGRKFMTLLACHRFGLLLSSNLCLL